MPLSPPAPSRLPGHDIARQRYSRVMRALAVPLALMLPLLLAMPHAAARDEPSPTPRARVGLQVGHWKIEELSDDQARLRGQSGGGGGGYREVDINLAIVQRTTALLIAHGVVVDILPAAVPAGYHADAFVAVHCDASPDDRIGGYKLARYRSSRIPERDDTLVALLSETYGAATQLATDDNITHGMTGYYAYNAQRYQSIIDPRTPAVIIELGYLTNPFDRAILTGRQDLIAAALAEGILRFLTAPIPAMATTIARPPIPPAAPREWWAEPPVETIRGGR